MPPVSAIMCRMTRTRNRKTPALTPPRRVVVALRMAGIAGQDKLNGIFEHLSAGHRWQLIIYRTRHEFTADVVRHELAREADGFIVGIPDTDDALAVLAAARAPTVVMNISGGGIERRKDAIAFVKSDSAALAEDSRAGMDSCALRCSPFCSLRTASSTGGVNPLRMQRTLKRSHVAIRALRLWAGLCCLSRRRTFSSGVRLVLPARSASRNC